MTSFREPIGSHVAALWHDITPRLAPALVQCGVFLQRQSSMVHRMLPIVRLSTRSSREPFSAWGIPQRGTRVKRSPVPLTAQNSSMGGFQRRSRRCPVQRRPVWSTRSRPSGDRGFSPSRKLEPRNGKAWPDELKAGGTQGRDRVRPTRVRERLNALRGQPGLQRLVFGVVQR